MRGTAESKPAQSGGCEGRVLPACGRNERRRRAAGGATIPRRERASGRGRGVVWADDESRCGQSNKICIAVESLRAQRATPPFLRIEHQIAAVKTDHDHPLSQARPGCRPTRAQAAVSALCPPVTRQRRSTREAQCNAASTPQETYRPTLLAPLCRPRALQADVPAMAPTYLATLSAFTHFLTAYTHTLLYLRTLYPRTSFCRSRFHNMPVYQSRHPLVCEWIRDAVAAVREELLAGTVARIAIVVYCCNSEGKGTGSARIMERYMLDVSAFPVVERGERNMEIEWEDATPEEAVDAGKGKQKALDAHVDVDLSEQFRAALLTLTTRCSQLKPLPPDCSFNITMELKDEADADPPIRHPQPWIPVQPSLQKTGRKGGQVEKGAEEREGGDLGGVVVTPIRTVEAGVFRFETWIEEGKAKFDQSNSPRTTSASSREQDTN